MERVRDFKFKGALAVSYGSMFFEGGLNVLIVALMSLLAQEYSTEIDKISLLISAKSFGTFTMLYLSGSLSDKFGRKRVIATGGMFLMLFVVGLFFSKHYYLSVFFALLGGIGHGLMDAPAMSILFDLFPDNAAPAMSVVQVFFAGGGMAVTLLSTQVISKGLSWRWLLAGLSFLGIVILWIILRTQYPPKRHDPKPGHVPSDFRREPALHREGVILAICTLLSASFQAIISTWLPTFAQDIKLFSEAASLTVLTLYQLGSVLGAFLFSQILRRHHATLIMVLNPMVAVFFAVSLMSVSQPFLVYISTILIGLFMGVYFSLCINMGGELFARKAGAAAGAVGSASMLGNTLMVTLSGKILRNAGIYAVFELALFLLAMLIIMAFIFKRRYNYLK